MSRKFDGKVYDFLGAHKTKKLAEDHKENLKKKGFLVRVVKLARGYGIYMRGKKARLGRGIRGER